MFWRLFLVDMERAVFSVGFLLGVGVTFAALLYGNAADLRHTTSMVYLLNYVVKYNNSFSMFILASTFPYASSYCVDKNSDMIHFFVARCGERKYALSKWVSCALSGGLSVLLGAALFLVFLSLHGMNTFPSAVEIQDQYVQQSQTFGDLLPGPAPWLFFVCMLAVLFLQGMFWSSLGLCVSGFLPSQYVVYSAPFISCFAFLQLAKYLQLPPWLNIVTLSFARNNLGGTARTLLITFCVFFVLSGLCGAVFIRRVIKSRRVLNV